MTGFALKAMHKGNLIAQRQIKAAIREKKLLLACSIHPFINACHATYNEPRHVLLLLGLAPGGELYALMSKVGTLRRPPLEFPYPLSPI